MKRERLKPAAGRKLRKPLISEEVKKSDNPNRKYKDTVFRRLFSEKDKIIELYNALEGTDYGLDTKVEIKTLESVFFIDRENDLCFTIADRYIVMGEHQSTINPNIPLRDSIYFGRIFEHLVKGDYIYGEKLVKIPTPEFYLMYNGTKDWDTGLLRLSDCFESPAPENSMELVVKVVNVSYNEKSEVLQRSETLMGYSKLISYIQEGLKHELELSEAIDASIKRCINEGVLEKFLRENGREIGNMLYEEVTWENVVKLRSDQAYERGLDEGRKNGILKLIESLQELNADRNKIAEMVREKYDLSENEAKSYMEEYLR